MFFKQVLGDFDRSSALSSCRRFRELWALHAESMAFGNKGAGAGQHGGSMASGMAQVKKRQVSFCTFPRCGRHASLAWPGSFFVPPRPSVLVWFVLVPLRALLQAFPLVALALPSASCCLYRNTWQSSSFGAISLPQERVLLVSLRERPFSSSPGWHRSPRCRGEPVSHILSFPNPGRGTNPESESENDDCSSGTYLR